MTKARISIVPFDMKYLDDYYNGFNMEITKYQWPDPFHHIEDAQALLAGFLNEMQTGETLFYSVLVLSNFIFKLEKLLRKCIINTQKKKNLIMKF